MSDALDYARSVWPKGFTKPQAEEALKHPISLKELRKLRAIEDTMVRRRHGGKRRYVVWRYKPYQLDLPFGEHR